MNCVYSHGWWIYLPLMSVFHCVLSLLYGCQWHVQVYTMCSRSYNLDKNLHENLFLIRRVDMPRLVKNSRRLWTFSDINQVTTFKNLSESIVTVQPVVVCFGIYYQNSLILPSSSFHLQWNLYSGDTLKTEASISWIEVSPEWRLGWGLFIINQQRQYKKWTSAYLCDMYQFKSHSSVCESSILKEIN